MTGFVLVAGFFRRRNAGPGCLVICKILGLLAACSSGGPGGLLGEPANPPESGPNNAPTIKGAPPSSVRIGDTYSYKPTAADPDGDRLTFQIRNIPSWATFNATTGELSGRPKPQDEGTFDDIVIAVSDGLLSAETQPFSITATMSELGAVTLSWHPPTHYEDGTPLTNLAGFNIYYGRSRNSFPFSVRVENPGLSSYVVENLAPNRYYFAATAFDSMGRESTLSAVVSAKVK